MWEPFGLGSLAVSSLLYTSRFAHSTDNIPRKIISVRTHAFSNLAHSKIARQSMSLNTLLITISHYEPDDSLTGEEQYIVVHS